MKSPLIVLELDAIDTLRLMAPTPIQSENYEYRWLLNDIPVSGTDDFSVLVPPEAEGDLTFQVLRDNVVCRELGPINVTNNLEVQVDLINFNCDFVQSTTDVQLSTANGEIVTTSQGVLSTDMITGIPTNNTITLTVENLSGCISNQTLVLPQCGCPDIASPTLSDTDVAVCDPLSIPEINASIPQFADEIYWYDSPISDIPIFIGNTFIPIINTESETTYFAEAINTISSCRSGSRTPITFRIIPSNLEELQVKVSNNQIALIKNNQVNVLALLSDGIAEENIEYRLSNGSEWQEDGTFSNLESGLYTAYARSTADCAIEISSSPFLIVNYPAYMTPNADNQNDTWQIFGLNPLEFGSTTIVSIYDRYGKLLKSLEINEPGWDGTYNNEKMPDADYWFTASYTEPISGQIFEFKGHFSLLR